MTEVLMFWKGSVDAGAVYERDANGQVIKTTQKFAEGGEPETITSVLDENDRLIEFNKHAYKYDKGDNPTQIEGEAGYTYNEADQLKEGPTAKYKYNENGQRTKLEPKSGEPATTYGYDQAGNMTSIEREKGAKQTKVSETTSFDATGLPQAFTNSGTKYKAAWNTAEPLPIVLEYENGAGEEEASFIYGPENLPIEEVFGLNSIYLHHDQQGSTRLLTYWQHGEIVGWRNYGPFGNTLEAAGDPMPLAYNGQFTDTETGLIWLNARKYDPNTAQFMSIDPMLESTNEPYTYVQNNPLNATDLSGLCSSSGPLSWECAKAKMSVAAASLALVSSGAAGAAILLGLAGGTVTVPLTFPVAAGVSAAIIASAKALEAAYHWEANACAPPPPPPKK
jgi:RHS repeat-associated protein